MSKMSEESIKQQEALEARRVYIADDKRVTRDLFIMQLALALYTERNTHADFQMTCMEAVIDEFVKGESADTLTLEGMIFSSYLEEEQVPEVRPLKRYTVSYDINIVPLIIAKTKRAMKWKRISTFVEATSFKEAKVLFKEQFKKDHPDRKHKMIYVEESTNINEEVKADEKLAE